MKMDKMFKIDEMFKMDKIFYLFIGLIYLTILTVLNCQNGPK